MPEKEGFYNPYRLIQQRKPVARSYSASLLRNDAYTGAFECSLLALTPLEVDYGSEPGAQFRFSNNPLIPGSTLKGVFRSIAEIVGGGCVSVSTRRDDELRDWKLCSDTRHCITCDMFGRLVPRSSIVNKGRVFFDAAEVEQPVVEHDKISVILSNPKMNRHKAFYPRDTGSQCYRKLYHHHYQEYLIVRHDRAIGKMEPADLHPVGAGTRFRFRVSFQSLDMDELALLTYSLRLQPGLAHKMGRGKPIGLGSVVVGIDSMSIRSDVGILRNDQASDVLPEEALVRLTQIENDDQLRELKLMLWWEGSKEIAKAIRYPSRDWFNENPSVPIRSVTDVIDGEYAPESIDLTYLDAVVPEVDPIDIPPEGVEGPTWMTLPKALRHIMIDTEDSDEILEAIAEQYTHLQKPAQLYLYSKLVQLIPDPCVRIDWVKGKLDIGHLSDDDSRLNQDMIKGSTSDIPTSPLDSIQKFIDGLTNDKKQLKKTTKKIARLFNKLSDEEKDSIIDGILSKYKELNAVDALGTRTEFNGYLG